VSKLVPCISANSSGFVVAHRALIVMPLRRRADYIKACAAYTAANDLGIRPALQECAALMYLINTIEDLTND
jgi:hypothetical protein